MVKTRNVGLPDELLFPTVLSDQAIAGLMGVVPSKELMAVGLDGRILWKSPLEKSCQFGDTRDLRIWLFEARAIVELNADGALTRREVLRLDKHERIGCLAAMDDGVLVSVYRDKEHPNHGRIPRVIRLNSNYEEVWSTHLPVNAIAYEGCVYMGVDTNWEVEKSPPWKPSAWLPYGDDQLLTSGDRVLASFREMPRSGIGCRYVLDADGGNLLWKSKPSPISSACSLGEGKFLMGDQGYGAFQTTLYQDGESETHRWSTHGYDIVVGEEIVSVQMSNDLSIPQHVVGLAMDGSVSQLSDRLPGYYSSKPLLMSDGNVYFWRAGHVWRWNQQNGLTSFSELGLDKGAYASSLQLADNRIAFNVRAGYAKEDSHHRLFSILEC